MPRPCWQIFAQIISDFHTYTIYILLLLMHVLLSSVQRKDWNDSDKNRRYCWRCWMSSQINVRIIVYMVKPPCKNTSFFVFKSRMKITVIISNVSSMTGEFYYFSILKYRNSNINNLKSELVECNCWTTAQFLCQMNNQQIIKPLTLKFHAYI